MLLKSKGIVIHSTKYGESSLISKVLSQEKGLITLISSKKRGKGNQKNNYFQPLSAIQFVCYISNKTTLNRVREISFNTAVAITNEDMSVNAIRFFLAEFLNRVIKEEEQNFTLYQFLEDQVKLLNKESTNKSTFHIHFLIQLLHQLGIYPNIEENHAFFDFFEGSTISVKPIHHNYCKKEDFLPLIKIQEDETLSLTKVERNGLLNLLISYYDTQLDASLENLKSKSVLELVFN